MSADMGQTAPVSLDSLKPGMKLEGTVKRTELYGAFVDVGVGNIEDVVKAGDKVDVFVLRVDQENGRIALSLEQPPAMTWDDLREGMVVSGKVVRVENFGAFVDIGAERPGMIHVSELASGYVNSPSDVVKVGQEVEAKGHSQATDHDLTRAARVDGDNLTRTPVGEPQAVVVPAR